MKFSLRSTLCLWMMVTALPVYAQGLYFPAQGLSRNARSDQFRAAWYTRHLQALQEPSLLQERLRPAAQVYRFLWLRTFDRPIAVRLIVKPDGTGTLVTKIASGAGGYSPGTLVESRTRQVSRSETVHFLQQVQSSGFWGLPAEQGQFGTDGSEWIVEGVSRGKYHVAARWSPANGPVYQLGWALAFELAKIGMPRAKIY